jgi:hypothetical protein
MQLIDEGSEFALRETLRVPSEVKVLIHVVNVSPECTSQANNIRVCENQTPSSHQLKQTVH